MNNDWEKIYAAGKLYDVELVKGHLQQHDIESEILNQKDRAFLTGDVELYVHKKDAEKARKLIAGR
jgi:hypothetical protein